MSDKTVVLSEERIAYLEGLVRQARTAAAVFSQFTQEDVDRIVKPMVLAGLKQAQYLARLAVEETKIGVMEDKAIKNMVATEFVYNYVKDKRTVGVIREYPERGLVEVAEPIGVIFSLTPITNPTSTVLFKCIMAIKTRNAVIFSPHPSAWRCCFEAVRIMYETAVKHGAPEGVFTCLESHTLEDNDYLMHHKDVGLIDATGGPGAVKAAYSSGKPALGVGPGNTPVYLEKIRRPRHGRGGHHHLEDVRQRHHLRLRADGGDRRRDLRPRAGEVCRAGRAHLQRERNRDAGAHRDRSRRPATCSRWRWGRKPPTSRASSAST